MAVLALSSCTAAPLVETEAGFVHRQHGFRIAAPPRAGVMWQRVSVEDSALAYRRSDGIRMSLASRCNVPLTRTDVLARHLRIGIGEHTLRHQRPVQVGALVGWEQVFDVKEHGALVRVKTVTFVVKPCVLDWVLTARDGRGFEEAEADFDVWWQSLRSSADTPAALPEATS